MFINNDTAQSGVGRDGGKALSRANWSKLKSLDMSIKYFRKR